MCVPHEPHLSECDSFSCNLGNYEAIRILTIYSCASYRMAFIKYVVASLILVCLQIATTETEALLHYFFNHSLKRPFLSQNQNERLRRSARPVWKFRNAPRLNPASSMSGGYRATGTTANSVAFITMGFKKPPYGGACAASILTESLILSAAHCFQDDEDTFDLAFVEVFLGGSGEQGTFFEVDYIDTYKGCGPKTVQGDFAIISIRSKIRLPFQPIILPDPNARRIVFVAGFGIISPNGLDSSIKILEIKLRRQTYKTCSKYFEPEGYPADKLICVSTPGFPRKKGQVSALVIAVVHYFSKLLPVLHSVELHR